ncbi:hypothetical protein ACQP1K_01765 [Sphaerimonospora sp. CA-214678]|uniref:hypothetical protein n=1 Tax=Sphaerimonospora sp. CA-214678 TaxID=3240029 RepID=UPI003D8F0E0A
MDPPYLIEGDQVSVVPYVGLKRLPVHPLGGVRVPPDLVVFAERLRSDRSALVEKRPDFAENERVALQSCGVMGLLVPDVVPDLPGLVWAGQAAETLVELGECLIEAAIDSGTTRSASPRH